MIKKEMDKMEFQFCITEEDYLAFNQYALLNSTAGKRSLLIYRLCLPAIFLLLVLFSIMMDEDLWFIFVQIILSIIFSFLFILFSKRILLNSVKGTVKNYKKDGKLPYPETGKVIFGEEGITTDMENRKNYSQIEKVCVTSKGLYLFFNCSEACILTDSCFSSQEEKEQLLSFLHNKIDPSRFFY